MVIDKLLPTKEDFEALMSSWNRNNVEIIELLIRYGLVLDLDDIKLALSKRTTITNLDRFKMPYDETLYYWCYVHNLFPYDDYMTIDKNVLDLRKMCRNTKATVDQFTAFIKDNNVLPDKYYYDHSCYYNPTINNFMAKELQCQPTLTTYYWCGLAKCSFQSDFFANWLNYHKITKEYMATEYDITLPQTN